MESIWSFLLQTLTVSLTAAVLLVLKWLLQDKLSPRWQYGVWGILALRILLPAAASRQVLLPLPMWVETWKSAAEAGLSSAYAAPYEPVAVRHVLPWITGRPVSVTDWLFVIYAAGVIVSILWYLLAYLRLRFLLRRGAPVSADLESQIARVAEQYGLKPCQAVAVDGLPTAFVCGIFRPILAVPTGGELDDKVLLHELLHRKYRDGLQNFFWCLLRSLHWCNPFLQYVFRRIGNDMESLCDQRVLERLDGEARREYGVILLSAANRRYARAPGTTSISNGGRQIARRIEAIARFKRYPVGMGLVSVCIALVLLIPTVWGMDLSFDVQDFRPQDVSELPRAMAASRIYRCTTPGGALDTYAKGLLQENGVYLAAASPLDRQAELEAAMRRSVEEEGWVAYHLDLDEEDLVYSCGSYRSYSILNLRDTGDGVLEGWLALEVIGFRNEAGLVYADQDGNHMDGGSILIPVTVRQEDGWVVEEQGPRQTRNFPPLQFQDADADLPCERVFAAQGKHGTVIVRERSVCTSDSVTTGQDIWGDPFQSVDEAPNPDAELTVRQMTFAEYHPTKGGPKEIASLLVAEIEEPGGTPAFPDQVLSGDQAASGYNWSYTGTMIDDADTIVTGYGNTFVSVTDALPSRPAGYAVRLSWDREVVEELELEEVDGNGAA